MTKKIKCGYCKTELKEGTKRCTKCGKIFNKSVVKNNECICKDKELFKRIIKIFLNPAYILFGIFLIIIRTYNYVPSANFKLSVLIINYIIFIIAWLLFPLCLIKLETMRRCKKHRYISIIIFIIFVLIMLYFYWRLIMSKLS